MKPIKLLIMIIIISAITGCSNITMNDDYIEYCRSLCGHNSGMKKLSVTSSSLFGGTVYCNDGAMFDVSSPYTFLQDNKK